MYNNKVATVYDGDKKLTIWSLALPLFIQSLLSSLIGTAGITVLSGYSDSLVTVTSVADQLLAFPRVILESLTTGTVILSSISFGKNDKKSAASICGCGLVSTFALSVAVGVIMAIFAEPLTAMMNLQGQTAKLCSEYLFITSLIGFPIHNMFVALQKLLICNGHSKFIPISGLSVGLLNALLSYAVLYVIRLPISDVSALALRTVIAYGVGLAIVALAFFKVKCPLRIGFDKRTAIRIIKIGIPASMCLISFSFSSTVTTSFLANAGEAAINTRTYINSIVSYVSMFFYSIALSNAVIMGRHRGAGRFEDMKILFRQNLFLALAINGSLSVLCFLFREPLMSMFTTNEEIIGLTGIIMLIDIPIELARGINHLSENSLNPNGDVKTTLIASTLSVWLFSTLLGYLLCVRLGMGLVGLWIGFLFSEASKSIVYLFRWHYGKWQKTAI